MEITINIEDYFTSELLKEEIRSAVKDIVKESVRSWFGDANGRAIVRVTAIDIVKDELSNRSIDFKKELDDAFLSALKDLDADRVFGYEELYANLRTKTHAQEVLDECVDNLKPEIEKKVRELYLEKFQSEDAAEVLADAFYRIMEKALKED